MLSHESTQVQELYYPALQALLKEHTGASRVHIFDHTQRRGTIRYGSWLSMVL